MWGHKQLIWVKVKVKDSRMCIYEWQAEQNEQIVHVSISRLSTVRRQASTIESNVLKEAVLREAHGQFAIALQTDTYCGSESNVCKVKGSFG